MMYDYSQEEWRQFTKMEKKIIIFIKKYEIEDKDRIRMLLGWPLEPLNKTTFRGHWSRLMKKISEIRKSRMKA